MTWIAVAALVSLVLTIGLYFAILVCGYSFCSERVAARLSIAFVVMVVVTVVCWLMWLPVLLYSGR